MIINLDQAAGIPVRFLAMTCGEFSATSFWINGFISNYNSVYILIGNWEKYLDLPILLEIKMLKILIVYDI